MSTIPRGTQLLIPAICVALLIACASQRVGSAYDRSAMFSWYQHFAWMPREEHAPRIPLMACAHDAIEAELIEKGYVKVADPAAADFLVDDTIGAHDRVEVAYYPGPYFVPDGRIYPDWWGHSYWGPQLDTRLYRKGILSIDVFDVGSRMPVWHGWAREELSLSDVKCAEAPTRAAVRAVLQRFPPR